jgi:hypothetical protein
VDWQPLDTHFNSAFYKQLLGHPLDLTDLEAIDKELHTSLKWIQENDPTGLDMYFRCSSGAEPAARAPQRAHGHQRPRSRRGAVQCSAGMGCSFCC